MTTFENDISDDVVCYTYYLVYGANSGLVYQGILGDAIQVTALFTKEDADAWIKIQQKNFKEPLIPVECKVVHQDIFFVKAMKGLQHTNPKEAMKFN